jgi:hypothetical protein
MEVKVKKTRIFFCFMGMLILLMAVPVKSEAQELIGLWHFDVVNIDSSEVRTTPDSSGHGNTGTLMPFGSEAPLVSGKFGEAISFSGIDQWVDCGAAVDNSITNELTLEAWIYYYGDPQRHFFILSNDYTHGTKKGYDFFLWHTYSPGRVYGDVGTGVVGSVYVGMPDDLEWHHVAVTWGGATVTLYVDGNPVSTSPLSGNYSDPGKNTYIGKFNWPSTYYPNGMIDEVRIYNYALSAEMINNHAEGFYEYSIDIKPGSDPNSINLGEQGKLTVAILGCSDLDVTQIDPDTIMLGSAGLATRGKKEKLAFAYDDIDNDGYPDLVVHFNVQELGLTESDTSLTLIAKLFNGFGIIGVDSIRIVPPQ